MSNTTSTYLDSIRARSRRTFEREQALTTLINRLEVALIAIHLNTKCETSLDAVAAIHNTMTNLYDQGEQENA